MLQGMHRVDKTTNTDIEQACDESTDDQADVCQDRIGGRKGYAPCRLAAKAALGRVSDDSDGEDDSR